jgi:hypothetical protein
MSFFKLACAASLLSLTGCAGVVTAFKNDPLQAYPADQASVYAMTGDRRTAVMMSKDSPYRFCAESLPDAVAAFSASSKASLGIDGKGNAAIEDAAVAGLLQTFQRTEIAEVFRQLGWNTCLAWAQGAITQEEYHALLSKMVAGGLEVMAKRASQAQVLQAIPSTTLVVATQNPPASQAGGKPDDEKPGGKKPDAKKPDETKPGDGEDDGKDK